MLPVPPRLAAARLRLHLFFRTALVLLASSFLLSACDGNPVDSEPSDPDDPVSRVELSLTEAALWVGDEVTITAQLFSSTGAPLTGRAVAWTSDNEQVATVTAQGQVTAHGLGSTLITATSEGKSAQATVEVATYDLVYESGPANAPELFRIAMDDAATPQRVLPAGMFGADPAPAPDGRAIAFVGGADAYNLDIYVIHLDDSGITPLMTSADSLDDDMPAWSADGRIVFRSQRVSADDIFVMSSSGGSAVNLTPDPGNAAFFDRSPAWSPDGARIAFSSNRRGITNIWVMDADGGNKQALTSVASQAEPAWSPDGKLVAFRENEGLDIAILNMEDGASVKIDLPGEQWMPAWSPDGRWLAFAQRMSHADRFEIYRMRPDGSDVTLITRDSAWGGGRNPAFIRRTS